jgi:type VI secretion system protein ImpG
MAGFGTGCELLVFLRDSELREHLPAVSQAVKKETFQTGCTPIVNLFERLAEPIRVSHAVTEYRVIPDLHRQSTTEIYSIDSVRSKAEYSAATKVYEPFYSFRHAWEEATGECFWYEHRRAAQTADDQGTDVYLSLVDLKFNPALPPTDVISAAVTCTNRDFAGRLDWRQDWGEIAGEGLPMVQARCLVKPTPPVQPRMRGALQWRLISHLAVNRLSIVQGGGLEALREILRLYCFEEDEETRRRIAGLSRLSSRASVSRVEFDSGISFCRGLDVELEFDEELFAGSGAFLMASVLERFFGIYSAINSWTRLTALSRQRRIPVHRWPARIGQQRVL